MAVFYKGVGFGRHYRDRDARREGIEYRAPMRALSGDPRVRHIVEGTAGTPYVSLTRPYSVALAYTRMGKRMASETFPAVVDEVTVDVSDPAIQIVDPVLEIARLWDKEPSYQHNGLPYTLMGIVDPAHAHWLQYPVFTPPPGGAPRQGPQVSRELTAMVRALRDSEILAVGSWTAATRIKRLTKTALSDNNTRFDRKQVEGASAKQDFAPIQIRELPFDR
jgi:hypothetical protein